MSTPSKPHLTITARVNATGEALSFEFSVPAGYEVGPLQNDIIGAMRAAHGPDWTQLWDTEQILIVSPVEGDMPAMGRALIRIVTAFGPELANRYYKSTISLEGHRLSITAQDIATYAVYVVASDWMSMFMADLTKVCAGRPFHEVSVDILNQAAPVYLQGTRLAQFKGYLGQIIGYIESQSQLAD